MQARGIQEDPATIQLHVPTPPSEHTDLKNIEVGINSMLQVDLSTANNTNLAKTACTIEPRRYADS